LLDPARHDDVENALLEAYDLIILRGRALRLPITTQDSDYVELNHSLKFLSRKLAQFLAPCQEALLMAATCGSDIIEEIKSKTEHDQQTKAVIYDAVASELADEALGWIMELFRRELLHEGKNLLTHRYSAGYGDFTLENQIYFYNLLKLDNMGIKLTESFLFVPEKTVTALSGITSINLEGGEEA
jgi:cobalamin-dependent methionine synthase I